MNIPEDADAAAMATAPCVAACKCNAKIKWSPPAFRLFFSLPFYYIIRNAGAPSEDPPTAVHQRRVGKVEVEVEVIDLQVISALSTSFEYHSLLLKKKHTMRELNTGVQRSMRIP